MPAPPIIDSFGMSHVGLVRTNNEDRFVTKPESDLYLVADGMGGAQAGELASQITADTLVSEIESAGERTSADSLSRAIEMANTRVRAKAGEDAAYTGMGTTVVAVLIKLPKAHIASVGDSRVYLQRRGELFCVTTDHNWVNDIGRGLGLTDDQLRTHPYRNVLTKAVGAADNVEVQTHEIDFAPGDLLLLCSDGLHGVIGEERLAAILAEPEPLQTRCEALIRVALEEGAPDNTTAVLVANVGAAAGDSK